MLDPVTDLVPTRSSAELAADVSQALTSDLPSAALPLTQPGRWQRRSKERENDQMAKAARRFLRALARRAVQGQDPEALAALLELARWVEQELAPEVIEGLRTEAGGNHSLTEIGVALGYPRWAARQSLRSRFKLKAGTGSRKGGAQPANLR